jgi:hypothetical protein
MTIGGYFRFGRRPQLVYPSNGCVATIFGHDFRTRFSDCFRVRSSFLRRSSLRIGAGQGVPAPRPGNASSAEDWDELLLPEVERQQAEGKQVTFRADAAFAKP